MIRCSKELLEARLNEIPTTDRLMLKLYTSKLLLSCLEEFQDPHFVESHRPLVSALVDALLYELNGAIDASLQDIREGLQLVVAPERVSPRGQSRFMTELQKCVDLRAHQEKAWISEMMNDQNNWMYKLRRFRNRSAHQDPIGWAHYIPIKMPGLVSTDVDFQTYFKKTYEQVKDHCITIRKRYGKYASFPLLEF